MKNNNIQNMQADNWIDSTFIEELLEITKAKDTQRQNRVEKARSKGGDQKEVDKERKSSDREVEKREDASNPWKGVVVVKTNEDGKVRLIPKNDFSSGKHELLYGQVSGQPPKPEVTPNVAQEVSTQDDFEASKTSNRLLGIVQQNK